MGRLALFLLFVLQLHYRIVVSSSLNTAHNLCPTDQSLLLLQFRQSINIDATASAQCDYENVPSYPKTMSWNRSTNCCIWDGVTCDELTGQVIGLDLSCSQLQGVLNSNTTLFRLFHLQSLNLAYNDFSTSLISSNFSRLESLTHLNLSNSGFSGQLPSEFLRLSNLISLDLSISVEIIIQPHIFELLLQNSTQLREVSLSDTTIDSVLPRNLSASLTILNLGSTGLDGNFPVEIFQLPNLQKLQLFSNLNLTGSLSNVKWNTSSALRYLDMSGTDFSGEVPESIGNLKSLSYLQLSFCNFSGSIPESLGNLTQMTYLLLFFNNFSGQVPSSLANLEQLVHLDLSSNSLEGILPNYFRNFKNLAQLALGSNRFIGNFPSSVINLTQLEGLDLSNNSLTGPMPPNINGGFPNLVLLYLRDNLFNSTIPSWIFSLPSLRYLSIESNQLTGKVQEFQYQSLQRIYLSRNMLHGSIPKSISKLVNLTDLVLSFNNFSGDVEVSLFSNLNQLKYLDLSFNNLSLITNRVNSTLPSSLASLLLSSCGVKDLDFLIGADNLIRLDLSDNMLHGKIFTDQKWYRWGHFLYYLNLSRNFLTEMHQLPFKGLVYLDLRSNLLNGPLLVPPAVTQFFLASANNLSGEIPSSICNSTSLVLLDLSNNSLSGAIPQCLWNMSMELSVLDLHTNKFHGVVPSNFSVGCNLRRLNLRDNQIEGAVPRSLSNCTELEVIEIGNNNLNGTFPWWLETLSKLQVLNLRANNLFGPLSVSRTGLSFPALRILDLSENEFTGILPSRLFIKLRDMKIINGPKEQALYDDRQLLYYQDSIMMVMKGNEVQVERFISTFTTIVLSNNKFQGLIPDVIGDLVALRGLNLSHNTLAGQIPPMLAKLTVLESLDLSSNELEGEIPQQLTALTYLSVLNLSQNQLVGSIPRGNQFDTFDNTSYLGNYGLCGFPLSKSCGGNQSPTLPQQDVEENGNFFNGFTWKAVLTGYGFGMVIGAIMGCLIFVSGKPKWFNAIVQQEGSKLVKKKWRKEVKWL